MDTLIRLSGLLQTMRERSDQRASFLHCYTLMSENMLREVSAGGFHDPKWMQHFVDHFAEYYFRALDHYERRKNAGSQTWTLAHDTALHGSCAVLQKLLLGINAHINYDLVLTLVDLLQEEWPHLSEEQRTMRHADYCHVNDIIGNTIDSVQDLVLESDSPGMELIDISMGTLDEWLISRLIRTWRDEVWEKTILLLDISAPQQKEIFRVQLDASTHARGEAILLQNGWRSLKDLW